MSRADDTTADFRRQLDTENRSVLGMLRRMTVTLTRRPFWSMVGVLLLDGVTVETQEAEVFSGVGFYARPKAGSKTVEAIVAHCGGRENPAIVATRDEATRRAVADIDDNETAAFNTLAILLIDKQGHIHARLADGTTKRLAFADELNDLRGFVADQFTGAGHVHGVSGGTTNATTPVGSPPALDYPGTEVLRGQ